MKPLIDSLKKYIFTTSCIKIFVSNLILFYLLIMLMALLGDKMEVVAHIATNWLTGIYTSLLVIYPFLRYKFPPSNKQTFKPFFGIAILTFTFTATALMYHIHNIFNVSSVNNDLCDAAWNLVTFFNLTCPVVFNEIYLKIRSQNG